MPFKFLLLTVLTVSYSVTSSAAVQEENRAELSADELASAQSILEELAEDYENDPMAINSVFGIKLNDVYWTISVDQTEKAKKRGRLTDHILGPHKVKLEQKMPDRPTWYFEIADLNVLELIYSGSVNAGPLRGRPGQPGRRPGSGALRLRPRGLARRAAAAGNWRPQRP